MQNELTQSEKTSQTTQTTAVFIKKLLWIVVLAIPLSWLVNEIFRTFVPKMLVTSTINGWYLYGDWVITAIRYCGYFVAVLPLTLVATWMSRLSLDVTLAIVLATFLIVQYTVLSLSGNYANSMAVLMTGTYLKYYIFIVAQLLLFFALKGAFSKVKTVN